MDTLMVCRFDDPGGAAEALRPVRRLAEQEQIAICDAAIVAWPPEARKPSTENLGGLTRPGELWGGAWGVLLGIIFIAPMAGPLFGAAAGAVAGSLADIGLDDDFIKRVRDAVTPGTSALFLLCGAADADRLLAELDPDGLVVIRCPMAREHEQRLLAALGEESGAVAQASPGGTQRAARGVSS